ncbi:13896_t:CDS:2 [Acaulospora colombiana]|uniref:13896_t:CDS:1 n=1 Tax=Acaulospora colombiana TaxID=27376 RepID=A0ACA9NLL8_9GLOM|nr:13896_t:CDS:2 [Acaulospora colombiana]
MTSSQASNTCDWPHQGAKYEERRASGLTLELRDTRRRLGLDILALGGLRRSSSSLNWNEKKWGTQVVTSSGYIAARLLLFAKTKW